MSIPSIHRTVINPGSISMPAEQSLRALERNGTVWLSAPVLEEQTWLVHGFTTRIGGVSTGETGTMNMSFAREQNQENVRENYVRITDALGIDRRGLVLTHQTHTDRIRIVTAEDAGKGLLRERDYTDIDGLITDVPGITLAVFMSDCVPVLAADPVRHAVGAVHSGWRGTVSGIGTKMALQMEREYGSRPEDLLCVIGPSICQNCYEVTEDVIQCFRAAYRNELWSKLFYQTDDVHYQLNLWEACRQNLLAAGVRPEHITVSDICTRENPDLLFSHRRQKGKQGNLAGFIGIR